MRIRAIERAIAMYPHGQGTLSATPDAVPGVDLRQCGPATGAACRYRIAGPRRLWVLLAGGNGDPLRQLEPWQHRDGPHQAGPACSVRTIAARRRR